MNRLNAGRQLMSSFERFGRRSPPTQRDDRLFPRRIQRDTLAFPRTDLVRTMSSEPSSKDAPPPLVAEKAPANDAAHREALATAIATELAPEVAIALLAKTERPPGSDEAALKPIAAGVSGSEDDDKIRVRLVFENGAVLPIELPKEAGEGLIHGLQDELDIDGDDETSGS